MTGRKKTCGSRGGRQPALRLRVKRRALARNPSEGPRVKRWAGSPQPVRGSEGPGVKEKQTRRPAGPDLRTRGHADAIDPKAAVTGREKTRGSKGGRQPALRPRVKRRAAARNPSKGPRVRGSKGRAAARNPSAGQKNGDAVNDTAARNND